jgi:Xaa-Pro aminopeptidase
VNPYASWRFNTAAHTDSNQQAIQYLSGYVDQISAYIVFPADGDPVLFADLYPHVPDAFMMSHEETDVRWGTNDKGEAVAECVEELGYEDANIGLTAFVGNNTQLPGNDYLTLEDELPEADLTFVNDLFDQVCLRKSDEEVEALRDGAHATDIALEGLVEATEVGATERELKQAVMTPFLDQGEYMFQVLGSTSMHDPDMPYLWEHQSGRQIQNGDFVVTEISAKGLQGYSGQISARLRWERSRQTSFRSCMILQSRFSGTCLTCSSPAPPPRMSSRPPRPPSKTTTSPFTPLLSTAGDWAYSISH